MQRWIPHAEDRRKPLFNPDPYPRQLVSSRSTRPVSAPARCSPWRWPSTCWSACSPDSGPPHRAVHRCARECRYSRRNDVVVPNPGSAVILTSDLQIMWTPSGGGGAGAPTHGQVRPGVSAASGDGEPAGADFARRADGEAGLLAGDRDARDLDLARPVERTESLTSRLTEKARCASLA